MGVEDPVELAQAFEVFDAIVAAGLEGSIHARRLNHERMDYVVTLSLVDRTQEQLVTLAAIVERYDLELDVDDHRLAALK
jgi:membrane-bound lytic murein transglycosylase MltF